VWIAASTHDGEEQQVLVAHRRLLEHIPELLLILVPRHPERFDNVRDLIQKEAFAVVSRTQSIACNDDTEVFLVDTMGEVPLFYAASEVAFVGGSLAPVGGHNLLEPAAQGLPIVTGPHLFNAQDVADKFVESDACRVVANDSELAVTVAQLLQHPEQAQQLGGNALRVLEKNRGSLQRLLVLLQPLLEEKVSKIMAD
jgi:3-deoxy-D-manno-octulosonic-acid transferase